MEQTFSTTEVGEILQVNPKTVYYWIKDGKIDAFRTSENGVYKITRSALIAYAEKNNIPLRLDEDQ